MTITIEQLQKLIEYFTKNMSPAESLGFIVGLFKALFS